MSARRLPRFLYVLFVSMVTLLAVILTGVAGAAAAVRAPAAMKAQVSAQSYGPTGPAGTGTGGFPAVITTRTVGPAGGTISVMANGVPATLTVPPGAFSTQVQIMISEPPDLAMVGNAGFPGYRVVAALGVQVMEGDRVYPGTFGRPLTLSMQSPSIVSSSFVSSGNGRYSNASVTAGMATVSFDSDPRFYVLTPSGAGATPISGATTPHGGKPLLGEEIAAGVLLLFGAAGLTLVVRRRRAPAQV